MRDEKGRYATGTGERGESSLYQGEVPSKGMVFMGCQHGGGHGRLEGEGSAKRAVRC